MPVSVGDAMSLLHEEPTEWRTFYDFSRRIFLFERPGDGRIQATYPETGMFLPPDKVVMRLEALQRRFRRKLFLSGKGHLAFNQSISASERLALAEKRAEILLRREREVEERRLQAQEILEAAENTQMCEEDEAMKTFLREEKQYIERQRMERMMQEQMRRERRRTTLLQNALDIGREGSNRRSRAFQHLGDSLRAVMETEKMMHEEASQTKDDRFWGVDSEAARKSAEIYSMAREDCQGSKWREEQRIAAIQAQWRATEKSRLDQQFRQQEAARQKRIREYLRTFRNHAMTVENVISYQWPATDHPDEGRLPASKVEMKGSFDGRLPRAPAGSITFHHTRNASLRMTNWLVLRPPCFFKLSRSGVLAESIDVDGRSETGDKPTGDVLNVDHASGIFQQGLPHLPMRLFSSKVDKTMKAGFRVDNHSSATSHTAVHTLGPVDRTILAKVFHRLDVEETGFIDVQTLRRAVRVDGDLRRMIRRSEVLNQYFLDKTEWQPPQQKLTFNGLREYLEAILCKPAVVDDATSPGTPDESKEELYIRMFDVLDRDKNGVLERSEILEAAKEPRNLSPVDQRAFIGLSKILRWAEFQEALLVIETESHDGLCKEEFVEFCLEVEQAMDITCQLERMG